MIKKKTKKKTSVQYFFKVMKYRIPDKRSSVCFTVGLGQAPAMASERLSPAPLDLSLMNAQFLSWYIFALSHPLSLNILFQFFYLAKSSTPDTNEQVCGRAAHTTSASQAYYNYDG